VAELGSFTKAANSLQMPNASVSTLVAQLEAHLQTKLLARTTRSLRLTDDGAAYLERVQRLLAEVSELETDLRGAHSRPRGRLRIDVPAAAGRHVISAALPDFFVQFPDITIDIGSSDRPVDLVMEGVDCVIRGGATFDESLVARKLGAFDIITCASPSYLKKHGTPLSIEDLQANHTAVNFFSAKTGKIFALDFEDDKGRHIAVQLNHRAASNDADTHVALACAGLGLAQLPMTGYVKNLITAGSLVKVLPHLGAGQLPLYVMYPRNRHLSARLRAFVAWVIELYAQKMVKS
jgi:LysR family transcriptional regulator, regulator for bpeEF and oprC